MSTIKAEHFRLIPVDEVTNPRKPGPLWVYQDYWWKVTEDRQILIYIGPKGRSDSPQCNLNRVVVERHLSCPFNVHVEQLPWAWLQFKLSDYTS